MAGLTGIVETNNGIEEVVHYSTIEPLYCFAHNSTDVFHSCKTYAVNRLSTGLSTLEVYDVGDDLVARALEFGVVVDLDEL